VKTVLVVEDHVDAAESLRVILELEGFVPLVAFDGKSALHLLCDIRPDVVVSDVELPGMSGAEFCSVLRAHPSYAHLPVVVITALDETQTRKLFTCFDAHLRKPIDPEALVELLHGMIDKPLDPGRPSSRHAWPVDRFCAEARKFLEHRG